MCPAERITKELQAGLQERRQQSQVHQQKQAAALEGFLADEISSHTCPICYELMLAPQRPPTLLFPCGEACTAQWLGHSVTGAVFGVSQHPTAETMLPPAHLLTICTRSC